MVLQVLLFGPLAAALGRSEVSVQLEPGAKVRDLLRALEAAHPAIGRLSGRVAVAIDQRYARVDDPLHEAAEVALVPPVCGG